MAIVKGVSFADALQGTRSADEALLDYIMDICVIVHDRMQELGIDQRELAKRMGKKDSQISRLLSGEANFTLKTLAQLDTALGLDLEIRREMCTEASISAKTDLATSLDEGAYGKIRSIVEEITAQSSVGRQTIPAIDPNALIRSLREDEDAEARDLGMQ